MLSKENIVIMKANLTDIADSIISDDVFDLSVMLSKCGVGPVDLNDLIDLRNKLKVHVIEAIDSFLSRHIGLNEAHDKEVKGTL